MGIENFNNEERILINGICKNENLNKLTKKNMEDYLKFSCQITDESDTMLTGLIEGTCSKVESMTEEEWDKLKMLVPFPVVESADEELSA